VCHPSNREPLLSLLPGITGSQSLGKIRHDFFFPIIQVQSSPQPPCSTRSPPHTISKTHSKHIVPSGGFAQPTLSLVLRCEDLRNPSQHVSLSTSDRVLVGYHSLKLTARTELRQTLACRGEALELLRRFASRVLKCACFRSRAVIASSGSSPTCSQGRAPSASEYRRK
jgi:hypothetical protein